MYWQDAWADDAQLELDAVLDLVPALRVNKGFVVKEDDKVVILTQGTVDKGLTGKTLVDGVVVIPKTMITEIKEDE